MISAKNKILHVCQLDKFIPPFIDFVEEHFDDFATRHLFFVNGDTERYPYQPRSNIVQAKPGKANQLKHLAALAKACNEADKIILHGLFNQHVVRMLALMPWVLPKCYWVMWGGDLYVYQLGERNWKWKLREFFRRPVIKKMGHLVTYIKGDYDLAHQWYGAKGEYHECFMYTSNLYQDLDVPNSQHSGINILVGNSADPSNNHEEIFDKLEAFKNQNIKIFAPLTYGNQTYAQTIIEGGLRRFGDKFEALTEQLPSEEYLKFLGDIDIAIFNHKRQQAMGNTIALLGFGKKVYIRSDVTQWGFFKDHGIIVYDIDKLDICNVGDVDMKENKYKIKSLFSEQRFIYQLSKIFN
jgi:dTDP-N-acetylfucosamine:lipid II N-acetylfucosaminyltransferase